MKAKIISQADHERLVLGDYIPLKTPFVIYIEPSGYCNLKCAFCPQRTDGDKLIKSIMPFELFKKLIDDLSEFRGEIKMLRVCGNGDPLMNKNIVKMMQYAKEKNVAKRIELVTNGILLNKDLIKDLPRFVDRLVVSVEGLSSEDYKKICNVSINFQNLADNIKVLHQNKGNCTIHIKIHNEAVPSEEKKEIFFNTFSDHCDQIFIEKLVPMWPQANTAYSTNEFRWGGGEVKRKQICAQIFKGMQIQADGEVVPCCVDWKRVNVIGDIRKNSVSEIWNGKNLRKLRIEHLTGNKSNVELCKDCTMNDYCEIDNIDENAKEVLQRIESQN